MTAPHRSVRQDAAPLCLSIRIVSGIVLLLAVLLTAASLYESALFPMVILLVFGIALAYGLSPVKYAIEQGSLVVRRRWDTKTFASVVRCSIPAGRPRSFTLRLWGNGGLFSGTGIFWNRQWGVFRAYVTRSKHDELVLVETANAKILISPVDPAAFVRDAGCARTS